MANIGSQLGQAWGSPEPGQQAAPETEFGAPQSLENPAIGPAAVEQANAMAALSSPSVAQEPGVNVAGPTQSAFGAFQGQAASPFGVQSAPTAPAAPETPSYSPLAASVTSPSQQSARAALEAATGRTGEQATACLPSGRNSTYRPVQISGTGSSRKFSHVISVGAAWVM
jgi:hypothetical protein